MWTLTVNYSAADAAAEGGASDVHRLADESEDNGSDYHDFFNPCDSLLMDFQAKYRGAYGYLACVLCCVGVVVNATNIVVLTRRQMLSPVNCLLTVVAAAEMGIVGLQLPASVYFYIMRDERFLASAAVFDEREAPLWYHLVANAAALLCQTAAAWAMVAVAACRYVSICHHQLGERVCTLRRAKEASAAIVFGSIALLLPNWLTTAVTPVADIVSFPYCLPSLVELSGWWTLGFTSLAADEVGLVRASAWLFATMGKVVPAVLLAVFTCLLVRAMRTIERRRTSLVSTRRRRSSSAAAASTSSRRSREQRRATRVLLAVVAVWLAVELPQGVMLAFVCSGHQYAYVYELLGDLINTGTLLAMSVNFFLYTSMMRRFRTTFCQTFLRCAYFSKEGAGGKLVSGFETSVTYR